MALHLKRAWQAQAEYQRIEKMYKVGAATQQAYDNVKASYQMAEAQEGASCKQFSALAAQKSTTHLQTNVHYAQIKQALAHIKQANGQLTLARDQYNHVKTQTKLGKEVESKIGGRVVFE